MEPYGGRPGERCVQGPEEGESYSLYFRGDREPLKDESRSVSVKFAPYKVSSCIGGKKWRREGW